MLRHFIFNYLWRIASAATAHNSSPAKTARCAHETYNIHVGIGMDKKLDLVRIAEVINHDARTLSRAYRK